METYRKKQTQRQKKVFTETSGGCFRGCVIPVSNSSWNDSKQHSLEPSQQLLKRPQIKLGIQIQDKIDVKSKKRKNKTQKTFQVGLFMFRICLFFWVGFLVPTLHKKRIHNTFSYLAVPVIILESSYGRCLPRNISINLILPVFMQFLPFFLSPFLGSIRNEVFGK